MRILNLCCVGLVFLLAGQAMAQTVAPPLESLDHEGRRAERTRIRQEHELVNRTLQQAEVVCYQRFAVEDCLRAERRRAREARAGLRQRESALHAIERRERAAQSLNAVQGRQSARSTPLPPASKTREMQRATEQAQTERQRQAQERARLQQGKQSAHGADQAHQARVRQERAVQARQRLAEKEAAAKVRSARVQRKQAQDAAAGRKPAAPLPPQP